MAKVSLVLLVGSIIWLLLVWPNCYCSTLEYDLLPADDEPISYNHHSQSLEIDLEPKEKILSGKHYRLSPFHLPPSIVVTKNSTGHAVKVNGSLVPVIEWLSHALNFTFEFIKEKDIPTHSQDVGPNDPGTVSYITRLKKADMAIGVIAVLEERNQVADIPYPLFKNGLTLMIPAPTQQETNKLIAISSPFQPLVWLLFAISLLAGSIVLFVLIKFIRRDLSNGNYTPMRQAIEFIMGIMVVQGSMADSAVGQYRQLVIRLFTGAWCLAGFVLVTAYSSVLISFVTAPNPFKPLVNSIEDMPAHPNVKLFVNRNLIADYLFTGAGDNAATFMTSSSPAFKYLSNQLISNPKQRCDTKDECINHVRKDSGVYVFTRHFILDYIGVEYKKTGKCDLFVAKEQFFLVFGTAFILEKNSLEREYFSRELMKIEQSGLAAKWWKDYGNDPSYCLGKIKKHMKNDDRTTDKHRLSLKDLSGAFLILIVGYVVSIITFIFERLMKPSSTASRERKDKRQLRKETKIVQRRNSIAAGKNAIIQIPTNGVPVNQQKPRRNSIHAIEIAPPVTEVTVEIG